KADFISGLASQHSLHFLALTETWITHENLSTPAALSSAYNFSHSPRQTGRGGGTVSSPTNLHIIVIYRPPCPLEPAPGNQSVRFKPAHSTETALITVTERLHAARSAKLSSVLILLDLSAAFDTVNHKILLSVLTDLGITGTAWKWFESYLEDRHYQVCNRISAYLTDISSWMTAHHLKLNPSKTQLHYILSTTRPHCDLAISFRNSLITPTEDTRSLGVILDGSLGCADYGLRHLVKEYKEMYSMGSLFIMRDFYVDDGIATVDRPEEAIQLADEAKKFCHKLLGTCSPVKIIMFFCCFADSPTLIVAPLPYVADLTQSDQYGCVHWQPEEPPFGGNDETLEEQRGSNCSRYPKNSCITRFTPADYPR
ncbi:hypothetical protein NFI96_007432, partial [Prochilodus magdalenae]